MDKAMEALKPCPFCGGEAELSNGGPGNWYVRCPTCKATSNDMAGDRAIAAWNTRATPEPVAPTVSPDIAGLVEKHRDRIEGTGIWRTAGADEEMAELATALQFVAQERDAARAARDEADNALVDRYRKPGFGTFSFPGDVAAIIRRLDAAEAGLSSARDEGLEMAAAVLEAEYPKMFYTAAAIRALKGTKP